jgi:tetratricopeptide (TPR) repeat protein
MFMGTIDHAAPEQLTGRPLDRRTDVFALASVAFELLAGEPPFRRGTPFESARARLDEAPPSLVAAVLDLPSGVDEIFGRALSVDKDDRPATAGAFVDAVAEAVGVGATSGSPRGPEPRTARRLVAVVATSIRFTDERTDPEDVELAAAAVRSIVEEDAASVGASVESSVGGEIVAVLGSVRVREDDAARAVELARSVIDRTAERGFGAFEVAAGVEIGEALVTREGETVRVTGPTVARALHLGGVATPGEIACGSALRRLLGRRLRTRDERADGWAVLVALEEPPDAVAAGPLVGRDHEMGLLRNLTGRVLAGGRPEIVTLVGQSGIGKSRLALELSKDFDPGRVRRLQIGPDGGIDAIQTLLRASLGASGIAADRDEAETQIEHGLSGLGASEEERSWIAPHLATLLGATSPAETAAADERRTAVARLLMLDARSRPLLIVIEDLHRAGDGVFEILAAIGAIGRPVPIVAVATARDDIFERRPGWAAERRVTSVAIEPLPAIDSASLVDRLVAGTDLSIEDRDSVVRRAGGNPLYVEELVRLLVAADGDQRERERISLPTSITALIAARIDTLPSAAADVLRRASIVGERFWPDAVDAVSAPVAHRGTDGARSLGEGLAALAAAEMVQMIEPVSGTGDAEYAFWHPLVREVAYGQVPRGERAKGHAAVAAWLATRAPDRIEERADHTWEAIALTTHDEVDPVDRHAAARLLLEAGERAMAIDVVAAQSRFERAVEVVGGRDKADGRLLLALGDSLFASDQLVEASEILRAASERSRASGDHEGEAKATVRLASVLRSRGEVSASYELRSAALPLLEGRSPTPELVTVYAEMAGDRWVAGEPREALTWVDRAYPIARQLGQRQLEAAVLANRGGARLDLGERGGIDDLREAVAIAKEAGAGQRLMTAYANLAEAAWLLEGPAAALDVISKGEEIGSDRGLAEGVLWLRGASLAPLLEIGDSGTALARGEEVLEACRLRDEIYLATVSAPVPATVYLEAGDVDRAEDILRPYLATAREIAEPQVIWVVLPAEMAIAAARGDDARLRSVLEELGSAKSEPSARLSELTTVIRSTPAASRAMWAERLSVDVQPWFERHRLVLATLDALTSATDAEPSARSAFLEVAEGWERFGNVLEAARCRRDADRASQGGGP